MKPHLIGELSGTVTIKETVNTWYQGTKIRPPAWAKWVTWIKGINPSKVPVHLTIRCPEMTPAILTFFMPPSTDRNPAQMLDVPLAWPIRGQYVILESQAIKVTESSKPVTVCFALRFEEDSD